MTDKGLSIDAIISGWDEYQQNLVSAVSPLTPEQLGLRAAPQLRTIGELVAHIVVARVGWFHFGLGEGGKEIERFSGQWAQENTLAGSAAQLVEGLSASWELIRTTLKTWSAADLHGEAPTSYQGKPYLLPRQFIVWHLIEHDIHHGGELFFTLGMHQLATPPVGVVTGHIKEV
jgi:uncharacterized damage-inducible protein DinB